jgi:hypothetical protein
MKRSVFILTLMMAYGVAIAASMPTPTVPKVLPNTPMNRLTIRLRQQNIQIQRDVKAGKLTMAQAKTLRDQVEAIRKQESAYIKANGTPSTGSTSSPQAGSRQAGKYLTDAQVAQLNEQLNTLSKSIPIK